MRMKELRTLRCESLEDRQLLACPALPLTYRTAFDTIPIFADADRLCTVKQGAWNDPSIWSGGTVPTLADDVQIDHRVTLAGDGQADDVALNTGGRLAFVPTRTVTSKLLVGSIQVLPGGQLVAGSVGSPMLGHAEIVIRDRPLDPVGDPRQFGNGVLVLGGSVITYGDPGDTAVRLGSEVNAGDGTLRLARRWLGSQGGQVVVAGSDRTKPGGGTEVRTVTGVSADGTLTLDVPLAYDHFGAHDVNGVLDYLPHVASLTRSVLIRSENPKGVRGHVLATGDSYVNIRWAEFVGLGRTTVRPLDNSTFAADGSLVHFGTNQIGRYSLHLHHVSGPANPTRDPTRTQFYWVGNSIHDDSKWGYVVHDSHYGVIDRNVAYSTPGSGFVTEDGNESFNRFTRNFSALATGSDRRSRQTAYTQPDFAHAGHNFWFQGVAYSTFEGNVGTGAAFSGWEVYQFQPGKPLSFLPYVPAFPGGRTMEPSERVYFQQQTTPGIYRNNEMYGQFHAFEWWTPPANAAQETRTENFVAWHSLAANDMHYPGFGMFVAQDWVVRGDWKSDSVGFRGHPQTFVIRGADVQGVGAGYVHGSSSNDLIEDSYFVVRVGIVSTPDRNYGPSTTTVRNVRFDAPPGLPLQTIQRLWRGPLYQTNHVVLDRMIVEDYQGDPANDFAVYYHNQQHPEFVVPQTGSALYMTGSPEAGLTNQENWDKYGIAIGGEIAPCPHPPGYSEIMGHICR